MKNSSAQRTRPNQTAPHESGGAGATSDSIGDIGASGPAQESVQESPQDSDTWFPTWHRAMCRTWNPSTKRLGVRDIQEALLLGEEAYQPDRMRLVVEYLRQAGAKRSTIRGRDLTPLARWIRDPGFHPPREVAPPDVLGGGLHALLDRFKDKEQEYWVPAIVRWIRMATAAEVPHRWAVKDEQTGETPLWAAGLIEDLNAPAPAPITWRDLPPEERQALVTRIADQQNLSLTIALLSSFPAEDLGLDKHWGPILRATWGLKVVPLPKSLVTKTPALASWWPQVGGTAGVWMGIGERADWTTDGVAAMVEGGDGLEQLAYIRDTIEPPVTVLTALLEKHDIEESMDWEHVLRFARRRDRAGSAEPSPVEALIPLLGRILNRDILRCGTGEQLLERIGPVALEQCLKTPDWLAEIQQDARARLVTVGPPWIRELFWQRLLHERGLRAIPGAPDLAPLNEERGQVAKTATGTPADAGSASLAVAVRGAGETGGAASRTNDKDSAKTPETAPAATGPAVTAPAATGPAVTAPAATGPAVTTPAATGATATGTPVTARVATGTPMTEPTATGSDSIRIRREGTQKRPSQSRGGRR